MVESAPIRLVTLLGIDALLLSFWETETGGNRNPTLTAPYNEFKDRKHYVQRPCLKVTTELSVIFLRGHQRANRMLSAHEKTQESTTFEKETRCRATQ